MDRVIGSISWLHESKGKKVDLKFVIVIESEVVSELRVVHSVLNCLSDFDWFFSDVVHQYPKKLLVTPTNISEHFFYCLKVSFISFEPAFFQKFFIELKTVVNQIRI